MHKTIVGVKFKDKYRPGEFCGREYTYFLADGIDLQAGDIVKVPAGNGEGVAQVTRVGIKESEVDERVMPFMKTITSGPIEADGDILCGQMKL